MPNFQACISQTKVWHRSVAFVSKFVRSTGAKLCAAKCRWHFWRCFVCCSNRFVPLRGGLNESQVLLLLLDCTIWLRFVYVFSLQGQDLKCCLCAFYCGFFWFWCLLWCVFLLVIRFWCWGTVACLVFSFGPVFFGGVWQSFQEKCCRKKACYRVVSQKCVQENVQRTCSRTVLKKHLHSRYMFKNKVKEMETSSRHVLSRTFALRLINCYGIKLYECEPFISWMQTRYVRIRGSH